MTWRRALPFVLLAGYAALVLFTGLGHLPLFGRDESLYAEAAREMYASGDWITPRVNGVPFFEKPPLNYWLAASSYRLFGVSPLSARVPAAMMGLVTVLLVALTGARVWGRGAGVLAGLTLASSLQFAFIGRMGIMDVPLTCLVTLALIVYAAWRQRGGMRYAVAFGALVGAGVLLKFLAGFIPALVAVGHSLWYARGSRRPWVAPTLVAIGVAVVVVGPWFLTVALRDASFWPTFVRENFGRMGRPMQGHGGSLLLYLPYYPVLILVGFFPWVMFLPSAMKRRGEEAEGEVAQLWRGLTVTWFWTVLIAFSLLGTKLPGYVTPLFPAMALLVGAELDRRWEAPGRGAWVAVAVGAVAMVLLVWRLLRFAPELGARVGAAEEVGLLVIPLVNWGMTYVVISVGAVLGGAGRVRAGVSVLIAGQIAVLWVVLANLLPVLSPYMEGAREYRLAQLAREKLPKSEVVLYEARPEAVCFVLGHPVRVFGERQEAEMLRYVSARDTALIVPTKNVPAGLRTGPRREVGNYALVELKRGFR